MSLSTTPGLEQKMFKKTLNADELVALEILSEGLNSWAAVVVKLPFVTLTRVDISKAMFGMGREATIATTLSGTFTLRSHTTVIDNKWLYHLRFRLCLVYERANPLRDLPRKTFSAFPGKNLDQTFIITDEESQLGSEIISFGPGTAQASLSDDSDILVYAIRKKLGCNEQLIVSAHE